MRFSLRQMQIFDAVGRRLSYTRAAEELHLTQPAVFAQVRQLEEAVGLPLLERVGKRLHLTAAGEEVLAASRETLDAVERLEMRLADMQGLKRGRLRIAMVTTAKYLVPRLLGEFCSRHPGIEASLTVTNREKLLARLAANEDDLVILGKPPSELDVVATPIADNPLVVLARHDHPLAGRNAIPPERIAAEPFVLREPGSGTRLAAEDFFAARGCRLKVRMELGSNEAIKQAIVGGLGISVLSRHTLALEGDAGPLRPLDVAGFPLMRQWHVAYPAGKHLSAVASAFIAHLLANRSGTAAPAPQVAAVVTGPVPAAAPAKMVCVDDGG
ncbi:LysR family transcriptional regulator [Rubrivivax benzoatilyticus]|uniref:LysR family transcriptional regulator n=1 Tax=Rubrivivax benzoatilyticus TaxID=316997 RepID=A0ABX0HQ07_9BURK|nr:LysR family transcriptional regulator [Rubrivivax benzoatilyticus]EGJ08743.1 LysR family transcriptional regulator [Rubrivivax benzoatilyticus JA2 = ATCC BAA-35]NHK97160.1 LysR family transcriptional regulator [Rubrivivax benzoatilyticus]NHL23145.1 LysR family transcriptional regulator [Rubrivivax benzoatilyticus]